jgi:hypothetical protein
MNERLTEDTLVQQTTAHYFRDVLEWESIYAYNEDLLGPDGTIGRSSEKEIVLERYLRRALEKLNPGLPEAAYESAIKQIPESGVRLEFVAIWNAHWPLQTSSRGECTNVNKLKPDPQVGPKSAPSLQRKR